MENIDPLLLNQSEFADPEYFQPGIDLKELFYSDENRILVLGAGGLGCEIVKNLVLSGFINIDLIDMDQIELTNLNRQFLFEDTDIGKYKAQVVAEKIQQHYDVQINYHCHKIQDKPLSFFRQFGCIIAGLDNIEARRHVNLVVHQLVEYEDDQIVLGTQRVLIDGGTEGMNGQVRVIVPYRTSCYECTLEDIKQTQTYQICTIAQTPRTIEHCIAYIYMVQFQKDHSVQFDVDNSEHIDYVLQKSMERSYEYGIQKKGENVIDRTKVVGLVKNVIPAIASTNSVIAAGLVNEAIKAMSGCSRLLDNYYMYFSAISINSSTFSYDRKGGCVVCSQKQ